MHINFRDSKLTRILQPSLSGNARMAVICCATPSELYLEETRSTLQFASRAKLVKTNAQVNEVLDDRSIIRRLQRELAEARGQTTGPGTDHLRALENKAASAGTEAMEAKRKLDRLKNSILNATSLFGVTGSTSSIPTDAEDSRPFQNLRPRKRRQSDGVIPLSTGSTPLKSSTFALESPTTAPRTKKEKTSHPELSTDSELFILREALSNRSEISRALKVALEENTTLLQQKEEDFKSLEIDYEGLSDENQRALMELSETQSTLQATQDNLKKAIEEYDTMLAEKESAILEAFQKVEAENQKTREVEQNNRDLLCQLQHLQQAFDAVQEERVRSAFEFAQATEEKEALQAERESDKQALAEMNQRLGHMTTEVNDALKERETAQSSILELQKQLSVAHEERSTAMAAGDELQGTVTQLREAMEEQKHLNETGREELEYQLETLASEKNDCLARMGALEIDLKNAQAQMSEQQESLSSLSSERQTESMEMQAKLSELENQLACVMAEKDDVAGRAYGLEVDLLAAEKSANELQSKMIEMDDTFSLERQTFETTLAEAQEQINSLAAEKAEIIEQAEKLKTEVARLDQELSHSIQIAETQRVESEAAINELQGNLESVFLDKQEGLKRISLLEENLRISDQNTEVAKLSADALHSNLVDVEEKYRLAEKELETVKSSKMQLLEQFESLQVEHTHVQQDLKDVFGLNAELDASHKAAQMESSRQLSELEERNYSLTQEISELEATILVRDESLSRLQSNFTNLRTQVTSKEIEKSDLVTQIGSLSCEMEATRSEVIALESSVEEHQQRETELLQQIHLLQKTHDSSKSEHGLQVQEIEKLTERLSTLLGEKVELERYLTAAEAELGCIQEQKCALEDELREQSDTIASMEDNASKANDALMAAQVNINLLEMEKTELQSRLVALESENGASLVGQLEAIEVLESRLAENEEHLETLSREKFELAEQCCTLKCEIEAMHEKTSNLQGSFEAQLSEKKSELAENLEKAHLEVKESMQKAAVLGANNIELQQQIDSLTEERLDLEDKLKDKALEHQQVCDDLKTELHRCQSDLEASLTSKANALKTLQDRECERDEAVSSMEELTKKNQELSKRLSNSLSGEKKNNLESEIVDLRQSCLELKQLLASTTGSEARLREKLATSESRVIEVSRALEDSQYRLSQVEEELRQSEFAFEGKATLQDHHAESLEHADLLNEINDLKAEIQHERQLREESENHLKAQMGEEQRLLIQEGEKMMSELRNKALDLEQRLSESEQEAYTSRQQLDDLRDERESVERMCHELRTSVEELTTDLSNKNNQISSLKEEMKAAQALTYSLKENAVELKDRAQSDASRLSTLQRERDAASSELSLLHRQLSTSEKKKIELQAECDRLNAKLKMSASGEMRSKEFGSQIKHLEMSVLKRDETIKDLKTSLEEMDHLKNKIKEKDQRIKKLQQFKLTKEFAEEHKQLKRDNKRLRDEIQTLQSEGSDSALRTEVSELRFDKDALEKKLRKFASHCQRLEDDKAGMINAMRSCNIDPEAYEDLNEAVVHLCDQLASIQDNGSVASSRRSSRSSHGLERENEELKVKLDRFSVAEERLSQQVSRYQKELEDLRKKLKATSDSSDSAGKFRYLEQENLQLMHDVKSTKKQLQAAREEIEILRMNAMDNSTLDFGTVDLGSETSSQMSKSLSKHSRESVKGGSRPPPSSSSKKAPLCDKTNARSESSQSKRPLVGRLPDSMVKRAKTTASAAPGLGEAAIQGDETGECTQS